MTDVLCPNSAKYTTGRGPRPNPLAAALRKLQHAVNQCQDVIFFTGPGGLIERVNPAFEELTEYCSVEAVGQDLSWIAAEGPKSESYRRIWEQVFQGRAFRGNLQVRRKQRDALELDVLIAPVRDRKGRIASLLFTGRDTSEKRELETQLKQARRMDAIGTLAGGVAHDFNNMLMVISANPELALDSLPKEHRLWRHLQEILAASLRASDLTRHLLAFGRKQVQRMQVFSLNSVVEEACRMLPCVIGEDIEMRVALGRDLGRVKADSGQIEQVLLTLAIKARDAMPHGGKLVIETRLSDGRDNVISVHSEPGTGSTFKIYLPVAAPPVPETASPDPVETTVHGGSETLLVVEDEDAVRQSEVEFLSTIGYTVLSAASGREALEQVRARAKNTIDLMITDVVMPKMSGPTLAAKLASLSPDLKVLLVSGYADDTIQRKGVPNLTSDFLQKPFPLRSLARKIREVLEPTGMARAASVAGTV